MQVTQSLDASADGAAAVRLSVHLAIASPGLPGVAFEGQLPGLFAKPQLAQADIAPPAHSHMCMGCEFELRALHSAERHGSSNTLIGKADVHSESRSMWLTMAELLSVWRGSAALVDGVPCLAVADA